jgi:3-hydroxyisobutyrate dehydrogenase
VELASMTELRIGFIGLGNVGGQLAGNLLRHGVPLTVRDVDAARVAQFVGQGARSAPTPRELAEEVDIVITCLPSPAISAEVMEAPDGVLAGLKAGKIWLEMSTTDSAEARRLAARVEARGLRHGLSGLGRLSPRRYRQHLHLCRRRARDL